METPEQLILDTHAWLWLMEGDPRLAPGMVTLAEEASVQSRLSVCAVSIWEVVALEAAGRVAFTIPVEAWLDEALATPGLTVLPIDRAVAVESGRLPGAFAGDVPDRVIVATARVTGGVLATADPRIIQYASQGYVVIAEPNAS
jgi:PIN domain nuclease of toxin-antitoxin system